MKIYFLNVMSVACGICNINANFVLIFLIEKVEKNFIKSGIFLRDV